MADAGELLAHHVESDQNNAIHDDPVGDAIQQWLRYKRKRKRRRKARHFGHGEKDDGWIYD